LRDELYNALLTYLLTYLLDQVAIVHFGELMDCTGTNNQAIKPRGKTKKT